MLEGDYRDILLKFSILYACLSAHFTENNCSRTTMIPPLQKLFLEIFWERVLNLADLYAIVP